MLVSLVFKELLHAFVELKLPHTLALLYVFIDGSRRSAFHISQRRQSPVQTVVRILGNNLPQRRRRSGGKPATEARHRQSEMVVGYAGNRSVLYGSGQDPD